MRKKELCHMFGVTVAICMALAGCGSSEKSENALMTEDSAIVTTVKLVDSSSTTEKEVTTINTVNGDDIESKSIEKSENDSDTSEEATTLNVESSGDTQLEATTSNEQETTKVLERETVTVSVTTTKNEDVTTVVKEQEKTTVKKEQTTTSKKEETTTQKQGANICIGYDDNGNPILVTQEEWDYMNSEEYLLENGISFADKYEKSKDYEVLDYRPDTYGWRRADFWWEPDFYERNLTFVRWGLFCDSSIYSGMEFLSEMKGNAMEYMPNHPDYKETFNLAKETDYFYSFANMREAAIGKTTLYYRNTASKITGYGTQCPLIKSDEDLCNYIDEIIENGYTKVAYRYRNSRSFIPTESNNAINECYEIYDRLGYCLILSGVDLTKIETRVEYDSYHDDGYEFSYEGYKKCPYTKCKETQSSKELKEYIFKCLENGIMQTNVYVIEDNFSWYDFEEEIRQELYVKYGAKVQNETMNRVWFTPYEYDGHTFLMIKLTVEDDFYETNSLQEAKNYINECIKKDDKDIHVYLKLKEFNDKNMSDDKKRNIINGMINETDIRSKDPEHIGYMYSYNIRIFGDSARVTMSKCGT